MEITKEKIKYLAKLSRIEIEEDELEKFSSSVTEIIKYVEQLNEVNTDKAKATSQVTGKTNEYRKDIEISSLLSEELINAAPMKEGRQLKVKTVIGK